MRTIESRRRGRTARPAWTAVASVAVLCVSSAVAQRSELQALPAPLRVIDGAAVGMHVEVFSDAFVALSAQRAVTLTDFPLAPGLVVDLDVERFWVWGPATQFVVGTDQGDVPIDAPQVAFFRGTVAGVPESRVFLSASPGGLKGLIRLGEAQYALSPMAGQAPAGESGMHTIFDVFSERAVQPPSSFECEPVTPPAADLPGAPEPPGDPEGAVTRVALVAVEADFEFGQLFANPHDAAVYVCELMAVSSYIYETDINMKLAVSFVRVWATSADPYDAAGSGDQLDQFRLYWEANMGSVTRNVAHFVSGRNLGGGTAFLNAMCGGAFAYGVSGNMGGFFPKPLQNGLSGNWDVYVVPHELGHNFRSPHTHCYTPPVDHCHVGTCLEGTQVCAQGTIMSYCHLCPGGLSNIDLTFGSTVSAFIIGGLQSCIGVTRDPCFVNKSFAGTEMGTSSNPYRTVAKGTWFVAPGAQVRITAGTYAESLVICQPMTLVATGGIVRIGG